MNIHNLQRRRQDKLQAELRSKIPINQSDGNPSGLWLLMSVVISGFIVFGLGFFLREMVEWVKPWLN